MSNNTIQAPAERWQHGHDREVGGTGREAIAKPVQALLRSKKIGDAEVVAAERFYRAWAFGMEGVRSQEQDGPSGSPSPDAAMVARMDAAADYSSAARALDMSTMTLLYAVVLEERSIASIAGRTSGKAVTRIAERAAGALKALADHYARRDGSRRGYEYA